MNPNIWLSFLTTTIGAASAAAAAQGWITGNTSQTIVSAAGIAVPFLWGLFIHRDSKVVQTAGAIQGVKSVEIGPYAAPELQKLAMDPTVPNVVVAPSVYTPSSTPTQKR